MNGTIKVEMNTELHVLDVILLLLLTQKRIKQKIFLTMQKVVNKKRVFLETAKLIPCQSCISLHNNRIDYWCNCGCFCHSVPEDKPDIVYSDMNTNSSQYYFKCSHCGEYHK